MDLVDCQAHQVPALRAFFSRSYHPDYVLRRDTALLNWQFRDTPIRRHDGYHIKLAVVDGEIAACLGYIPVEVTVGREVMQGAWTANWMVEPRYRRLGLGPLLMRELTRELPVVLDLGISADAAALLPRMGWRPLGELNRRVAILDPDAAALLAGNDRLRDVRAAAPAPGRSVLTAARVDRFDDQVTTLWDTLWRGTSLGTRRSAAFLNWRYATHPVFSYRLLEIRHKSALEGIAVYRIETVAGAYADLKVGRITELFGSARAVDSALRHIIGDARGEGAAALDFFCADGCHAQSLATAGFLDGRDSATEAFPILFQPIDRTRTAISLMVHVTAPHDPSWTWYVTKGDGDQDRPN